MKKILIISVIVFIVLGLSAMIGVLTFQKNILNERFKELMADNNNAVEELALLQKKQASLGNEVVAGCLNYEGVIFDPVEMSDGDYQEHVDVLKIVKNVLAEWGSVLSVKRIKGGDGVFQINYSNNVSALFQVGVDKIFFVKKLEEDLCSKYVVGRSSLMYDFTDDETCTLSEDGFYNFGSKKVVELKKDLINDDIGSHVFLFKNEKDLRYRIFSPGGKYFFYAGHGYEGCGSALLNTESGETAVDYINCWDTVILFSSDENIMAIQSSYGGMNSPSTSFLAVNNEKKIIADVLLLLYREKNHAFNEESYYEEDFDVLEDIKVVSLDEKALVFNFLNKDSKLIDAGKYEFTFGDSKLKKIFQ